MKPPLDTTSARRVAQLIEDAMRDAKSEAEKASLEVVRQRVVHGIGANDSDPLDHDTDAL